MDRFVFFLVIFVWIVPWQLTIKPPFGRIWNWNFFHPHPPSESKYLGSTLGAESILMQMHGHVFVEILPVGFRPLVGDPPKRNLLCNWGDLAGTETPILRHTHT